MSRFPFYPTSHEIAATLVEGTGTNEVRKYIAEEVPVALRYNGFPHAVMLATPADLEDFVTGFSFTEGLIEAAADIRRIRIRSGEDGLMAEIELGSEALHRFLASRRIRNAQGRTGCGLCGIEDFADLRRPAFEVRDAEAVDEDAVRAAVAAVRDHQPLSRATRAAHAAAWADTKGRIVAVREDIGRHNALDKLIGSLLRGTFEAADGFCLITSRCSFEMAQKAIAAGFPVLVSISAPTAYAIRTAQAAGLALYSISRDGGQLLYTGRRTLEAVPHVNETQAWTEPRDRAL